MILQISGIAKGADGDDLILIRILIGPIHICLRMPDFTQILLDKIQISHFATKATIECNILQMICKSSC